MGTHGTRFTPPPKNGVCKRGMRTRAERAHALLLASGLPHFSWEEAMKHSAWLQDHTPTCAPKGKTPYEMGNNRKPHLAGIQEFGAVAYIKDLVAGKLDARAKKGRFVGYDSESKGYRIYWPKKWSITVEWNIVFNQDDSNTYDDTAIIMARQCLRGRKRKSFIYPRTMLWMLNHLKTRNLVTIKPTKIHLKITKPPNHQILFHFHQLKSHKLNLSLDCKAAPSNLVAAKEQDTRLAITKP